MDVTVSGSDRMSSKKEKQVTTIVLMLGKNLRMALGDLANEAGLVLSVRIASRQRLETKGNTKTVSYHVVWRMTLAR